MKLLLLFLIGCIELRVQGKKKNDILGPGPLESSTFFRNIYATETSHETYQPIDPSTFKPSNHQQDSMATTSSMQREFSNNFVTTITDSREAWARDQKENEFALKSQRYEDKQLSLSKEPSLFTLPQNAAKKSLQPDNLVGSMNGCSDVGSSQIFSYLKLSDSVINVDFNRDEYKNNSNKTKTTIGPIIEVDVTNDVFETRSSEGGLLTGIIYKVEVYKHLPHEIVDFIIETTVDENVKCGEFSKAADSNEESDFDSEFEKVSREFLEENRRKNSPNESQASNIMFFESDEVNTCEKNVLYHKISETERAERNERLHWNWSFKILNKNLVRKEENHAVNFRLLYRQRNRQEIFQLNLKVKILRECSLIIKDKKRWLDSSALPSNFRNCTIRFSSKTNRQLNEQSPGVLIKLLRLNVPCNNGGYLQFGEEMKLCGKLEEIEENRRTLYFHSYANTSLSVFNHPKFHFIFKPVDYCFNITMQAHNSSFVVNPTLSALKCHFKIHLPYGNRINLKLQINSGQTEASDDDSEISFKEVSFNKYSRKSFQHNSQQGENIVNFNGLGFEELSLSSEYSLPNESPTCVGIFIEIINRRLEMWNECINKTEVKKRSGYSFISTDNVLLIRLTKNQQEENYLTSSMSGVVQTSSEKRKREPLLSLEYAAMPIETIVSKCAFGWIAVGRFCMSIFNEYLSWKSAEDRCNTLGGHLASIQSESDQQLTDQMLLNSPHYNDHMAYWIGATDETIEGDFRWTDGSPFSFSKWFPGWQKDEFYNRQPNDDGLSKQDCVEIRRKFYGPVASALVSDYFLTDSFMWNDRDCSMKNFFLCERLINDEPLRYETEDCNRTIYLTRDKTKVIYTSPGFPSYLDNLSCFTFIVAPKRYEILIEFEEFILEHEAHCSYDFLEIFNTSLEEDQNRSKEIDNKQNEHQQLIQDFLNQRLQRKLILQPSNTTYNTYRPPPSAFNDRMQRKICGDWTSKLKLLRYRSKNMIGLHFSTDYSQHFGGFRAKISLEKETSECVDERFRMFNDSCYLTVSFPEVEWIVAQKICQSKGASLSSVSTPEEHRFIVSMIKSSLDYNPRSFYWLGAEYSKINEFEWVDGSKMTFSGWFPGSDKVAKAHPEFLCLGLKLKMSHTPMLLSNLYWAYQKCSYMGGYVCKKNGKSNVLIQNQTITGIEGRLTSPNYPNHYAPNINYWVRIIAPEKSRIVIQFQKLDMEQQQECLYDYVSIQDADFRFELIPSRMEKNNWKTASFLKDLKFDYAEDGELRKHYLEKRRAIRSLQNQIELKNISINGTSPSFQPYVRWCGSHEGDMSQFDYVSKFNEVLLNFHTDHSNSGEGFSAIWRSIDTSPCPAQTLTSREGAITSPNYPHFLLNNMNCSYTIQAPIGRKIWIEFNSHDIVFDAELSLDLGDGVLLHPFNDASMIGDGAFLSKGENIKVKLITGANPRGTGFKLTFRTMLQLVERRVLNLANTTLGKVYHLNYPQGMPLLIDYNQHMIAPLGNIISLELQGVQFSETNCAENSSIEIHDKYGDRNGTFWLLCRVKQEKSNKRPIPAIFITSYLNTIHVRQRSFHNQLGLLNATVRVQSDPLYKLKLISTSDDWVESCQPNPCQDGGKCIQSGKKQLCQCKGHFTGRFCGLTICELEPCIFGQCELTNTGFKCHCQKGYLGLTCDQRQKPCNDNPCEGRGECVEKNSGYLCRCFAWFEGPKCEKRMQVPYRPLSERMLQEPFWLGLITVFVVLAVIGLVWCAKRHFPEKIEKLLQEEADRNRPAHLRHHHHISLREQLQVAGAANNSLMQSSAPQATATTPGTQKSILGRLGIRKPSILSLSSPQLPKGSTARTFSLDDLLRPLPRPPTPNIEISNENSSSKESNLHVGSPSPRKKRNNSTPTRKNAAEKKHILQHLVSPNITNKVTLGELIQLSENTNNSTFSSHDHSTDSRETVLMKHSRPSSPNDVSGPMRALTRQMSSDPKLEKKVTFARLLSKMSAEISNCSDFDGNNHSSALSLPTDVQLRANSVPQSPCTNDIRSPHSTSSNQGSDSLSSSELALHDFAFRNNNRKFRPKVSSADSILAMFRNFASSNAGINLPASLIISPSSTPTVSSPVGDDESSTSSIPTPVSFSSGAPDSPVFYRQSTIEIPVLEYGHKAAPSQNLLHPPTILLEIPGNINKCLSPIREMPTPMPSPALTPIMPRPQRMKKSANIHDETISVTFSDEDDKNVITDIYHQLPSRPQLLVDLTVESNRIDSDNDSATFNTTSSENSNCSVRCPNFEKLPAISIDTNPVRTPENEKMLAQRPKNLIIPELIIQTPSPTRERLPVVIFPGSPPPQRASIGEGSGMFPNKQQQKRLMMQFDKPGSLDFPFTPPMITVTANMSETESDAEFTMTAKSKASAMSNKLMPISTGMSYLSPFSMCTRGDRAPSEGNLSSSGYSSMASPCGSNSKLCAAEEDPDSALPTHPTGTSIRRHQSILKKPNEGGEKLGINNVRGFRKRSDSETLSDETLLESNDEGIGTDHLDEKIEDGDIRSARDLEVFIGKELLEHGKTLMNSDDVVTMSQLQLPSIVIQSESGSEKLSPVSSRSESPLSDRNNGMGRFSPQFYGKKERQLPFTDSDGLYDFPSSDGKGGISGSSQHRKTSGKRRERRSSKTNLSQSPSKNSVVLEIPSKAVVINQSQLAPKLNSPLNYARKSPKRRPHRHTPSSSSSTESLTAKSSVKECIPSIRLRDSLIENIELKHNESLSDDADKYGACSSYTKKGLQGTLLKKAPPKKVSRMKAIGHQIRFLRRLQQALKERDKNGSDVESDVMGSPEITLPLLSTNLHGSKPTTSHNKFSRQKRVTNVYSFEPDFGKSLMDKDFLSD